MEDDLNNSTPVTETEPAEMPTDNSESVSNGGIETLPPNENQLNNSMELSDSRSFIKNLLAKAGEKIQFNKNKKLDKIMELARQKGSIDNADVEKLLRASHTTSWRYLNQFAKQGRLKVSGKSVDEKYEPL